MDDRLHGCELALIPEDRGGERLLVQASVRETQRLVQDLLEGRNQRGVLPVQGLGPRIGVVHRNPPRRKALAHGGLAAADAARHDQRLHRPTSTHSKISGCMLQLMTPAGSASVRATHFPVTECRKSP